MQETAADDVEMKDESSKTDGKPTKKGRVGDLVSAEKKARRRSSLGGGISLPVPGIPGMSNVDTPFMEMDG